MGCSARSCPLFVGGGCRVMTRPGTLDGPATNGSARCIGLRPRVCTAGRCRVHAIAPPRRHPAWPALLGSGGANHRPRRGATSARCRCTHMPHAAATSRPQRRGRGEEDRHVGCRGVGGVDAAEPQHERGSNDTLTAEGQHGSRHSAGEDQAHRCGCGERDVLPATRPFRGPRARVIGCVAPRS
jgi:hypothetical protein